MKRIPVVIMLALIASLIVFTGQAFSVQIGADAFGSSSVVESFEGVVQPPPPPYPLPPGDGWLHDWSLPYALPSGVSITGGEGEDIMLGDSSIGTTYWEVPDFTSLSPSDIPDGSAFMTLNWWNGEYSVPVSESYSPEHYIEYTLPYDVKRVGAYVVGGVTGAYFYPDCTELPCDSQGIIGLWAYDSLGNLVEEAMLDIGWKRGYDQWSSNFLGVESDSGIRTVRFSGAYLALDALTFEVPEPPLYYLYIVCLLIFLVVVGTRYLRRSN